MIIITGAAGFIGSCLVARLNEEKIYHLGLVDDFSRESKKRNYENKRFLNVINRDEFIDWFDLQHDSIEFVFHLGARTDTTEFRQQVFDDLNLHYNIPLIYASSAATYGAGEHGYTDDHGIIPSLKPLNPYGISKNEFDKWVLQQEDVPPFWCGLKFFNVYGPNEYHKARMASVIFHTYHQIKNSGGMKLFRSHKPGIADGHQSRDFIYVMDVLDIILYFMRNTDKPSGIYNFGTGQARTFLDLAKYTFAAMGIKENISYIDTPEDIRDTYQYFTQAEMQKLRSAGYDKDFTSLEDGVNEYVTRYLTKSNYY
jgi:ADP-L-glycero-D-manno-heptose 6-epimerase